MSKVLDHHEAIRLLREVVKGREDYVYSCDNPPGYTPPAGMGYDSSLCYYRDAEGKPSCVVGCVLDKWEPEIALPEGIAVSNGRFLPDRLTDKARSVLFAAQSRQDDEYSWEYSLLAAQQLYDFYRRK